MPLFNIAVKHGKTQDEARARLALALDDVRAKFGPMIQRTDWAADRNAVHIAGQGFVIDLRVDAESVHASGDVLGLGALLGKPLEAGVRQIVHSTFGKG